MSLSARIRAGIGLHAVVNVGFALGALAATGAPAAMAVASSASSASTPPTLPPAGSPVVGAATSPAQAATVVPPTLPTTAPAPTSTTTSARPVATAAAPSTTTAPTMPATTTTAATGEQRRVESTGYCLEGITASGRHVGPGHVAMNGVPLGTRWLVEDGPMAGRVLEVTDRIGHGSDFDIWFDHCDDAVEYGRRVITIRSLAG